MSDNLTWLLDVTVIEWLIILAMALILIVVGTLVSLRTVKAFNKLSGQSDNPVLSSESWHSENKESVFASWQTTANGLSKEEINKRLIKYGPNLIPVTKTRGPLLRFLYQFHNVLIYVLIVAAVVTAILQHWMDASWYVRLVCRGGNTFD